MKIPASSIIFFVICGIPLIIIYYMLLKRVNGFFWRTLGLVLLILFTIIALLVITFISKDFQPLQ